jgi:exonuclease SbcC
VLPEAPVAPAVVAAKAAGTAARAAADAARSVVARRDAAVRDLEKGLAAASARADQLVQRLSALDGQLAEAPEPAAVEHELSTLERLGAGLERAGVAVRAARDAHRRTAGAVQRAEQAQHSAWRDFDTARDGLAGFAPPPADRDDLAVAWSALAAWAVAQTGRRQLARGGAADAVERSAAAERSVRDRLDELLDAAVVELPAHGDHHRAVAVAVERAEAAQRRVRERIAESAGLRARLVESRAQSRVARELAGHLRANNFERWLLAEALDLLVDGASRILRELSGNQYDLVHDRGEFFVLDHHDAGLRRGVRTLSGGETFQASLALALALSEQLAGLSSSPASLESIVLDEGFGTLDAATLDVVAATLENLAARGDRMVGVVTHVPALADRIPVRFEVRKDARTASVERVNG